jgi:hypothetical protein
VARSFDQVGMDAGYNGFISFFAKQKTYGSKMARRPFLKGESRRLSPAQGIEAEIPQTPALLRGSRN